MRSLGTRITIMILCVLIAALVTVTACSAFFIIRTESKESDQLLLMLLYHPQIQPGMDAAQCEQVIRSLYY